jgi:hypothetical protein
VSAPTAPTPDDELLARARRAVMIRLREKREKDEAYRHAHGVDRPNAMRDAGKFARWYLDHLLTKKPAEIDEVLDGERLREEDRLEREKLRAAAPRVSADESPAAKAYRAMRERRT